MNWELVMYWASGVFFGLGIGVVLKDWIAEKIK